MEGVGTIIGRSTHVGGRRFSPRDYFMHLAAHITPMLTAIAPKLPMRQLAATRTYYVDRLGFTVAGTYDDYLIVERDGLQLHFFRSDALDPLTNDGQVYLHCTDVDALHRSFVERGVAIHPNGGLRTKPWGQREFAVLDPDHSLLTFGQAV